MSRHIVLVGQMAAGKTTVGTLLARRLGRPFFDSDRDIERRSGLSAAEFLERNGLEALHRLEEAHLLRSLRGSAPAVIAAAAATVDRSLVRRRLRGQHVIWLRAPVGTLVERIARDPRRPILGEAEHYLERLQRRRRALFAGIATGVVDTRGQTPESIVDRIVESIRSG